MEMSTAKTITVFVIIFGCFTVLYPKIFHPMLMHAMGFGPKRDTTNDNVNLPPHLKSGGPPNGMDDISRQMRSQGASHPHPGLRAAAEMRKQANAQQGGSSSKGMMSVVLPMYAIGIVLYLLYTLSKVFGNKKDDKMDSDNFLTPKTNPFQKNYDTKSQTAATVNTSQQSAQGKATPQQSRNKDLESLLLKADEKDLSDNEMFALKRRLLETEEQMTRILQAMEVMQQGIPETAPEAEASSPSEGVDGSSESQQDVEGLRAQEVEDLGAEQQDIQECESEEGLDDVLNKVDALQKKIYMAVDSSPDVDSYSFVSDAKVNSDVHSDDIATPDMDEYDDLEHHKEIQGHNEDTVEDDGYTKDEIVDNEVLESTDEMIGIDKNTEDEIANKDLRQRKKDQKDT